MPSLLPASAVTSQKDMPYANAIDNTRMNENPAEYLIVAIASPLRRHFHYLPPLGLAATDCPAGARLNVPFGKRTVTGMVVGHSSHADIEVQRIKHAHELLDQQALLPNSLRQMVDWISDYYHHPHGDTLLSTLPAQLRKGKPRQTHSQNHWRLSANSHGLPDQPITRAPTQSAALIFMRSAHSAGREMVSERELADNGHKRAALKALQDKGLLELVSLPCPVDNCISLLNGICSETALQLNSAQQLAVDSIGDSLQRFNTFLLEGVTGSGKTEVYLQVIAKALSLGRQVLVLVPEIGLTPQTLDRFQQRFDCRIAVFHSNLTDRERMIAWNAACDGDASIVIGTRSAVFTPLARPGLIIVDEEHDNSYKQQDSMRYSARDAAIVRAQLEKIPAVLGSATPALETLHNAKQGKYQHLKLMHRAGNAQLPAIHLLDIRATPLHEGFCDQAISALSQALSSGQQAMVFINRRGFAPLLQCHDCGWSAQCQHCDARLTLHSRSARLRCHHCDWQTSVPKQCPRCHSSKLQSLGQGTERCSDALQLLFPGVDILRIDRDSIRMKSDLEDKLAAARQGKPAILVGTQMLAKGHHFPALSTVVILDIDQGLYSPDFRGPEKTLQLLSQVAGRAGREELQGQVFIQTHIPDHPQLTEWLQHSFQGVSDALLDERRQRKLPPFSHIAMIRADSKKPGAAQHFLTNILATRNTRDSGLQQVQTIGPLPSAMEKRAGRHRAQLLLKALNRKQLHEELDAFIAEIEVSGKNGGLRWAIDVDPQEVV